MPHSKKASPSNGKASNGKASHGPVIRIEAVQNPATKKDAMLRVTADGRTATAMCGWTMVR